MNFLHSPALSMSEVQEHKHKHSEYSKYLCLLWAEIEPATASTIVSASTYAYTNAASNGELFKIYYVYYIFTFEHLLIHIYIRYKQKLEKRIF